MVAWLFEFLGGLFAGRWTARRFRRTASQSRSVWRKRARVSREVLLPEPREVAEVCLTRVLASIGTLREASELGSIEAVTHAARRSSGTVVHVQLVGDDRSTRVEVAAWPGAQLFDWGESRRVVDSVITALGTAVPIEGPSAGRLTGV